MPTMKTTQTFELSPEDIQVAISEFIESRFGAGGPVSVNTKVEHVCTGYSQFERNEHVVKITATRTP